MSHNIGWVLGGWCIALLIALGTMAGCGENETSRDDIPPVPPRLVDRSADSLYAQRGIRPDPAAADNQYRVRIEWYPNPEPDVAGYRIWRRREDEPRLLHRIIRDLRYGVNLDRGNILTFIDAGDDYTGYPANLLAPDQPEDTLATRGFVWYIEAYDEVNNRSELSDSMYYRMVNNPRNMHVNREAPGRYSLEWQYTPNDDSESRNYYYMLRVFSTGGGLDSVMWYKKANSPPVILNYDGTARTFQAGQTYSWQLNVVIMAVSDSSRTPAGSATYTTFVYQD